MNFTDKKITHLNKEKLLLGAFIRAEREKENMSLGFMADIVGITKSYLSDIEHGKKMPSEYTLIKIMNILEVDFNTNKNLNAEVFEILQEMFQAFTEINKIKMTEIYTQIKNNNYYNSYAFLTVTIIELIYYMCVEKNNVISKNIIEFIEKYLCLLNKDELAIFYDLNGLYHYRMRNLETSQELFLNALDQVPSSSPVIIGMIYYHLAILNQFTNNQLDSLIYCEKASQYFKAKYNIIRQLYLDIYKGNCYSRAGLYEKALKKYTLALEISEKNKLHKIKKLAYDNIAWTYMKMKDYQKVIEFSLVAIQFNKYEPFEEIYTYVPYSLYKLNLNNDSLKSIEEYTKELKNSIHLNFLLAIKAKIKGDDQTFVSRINTYLSDLKKQENDYEMIIFIYKELAEYYSEIKNYEMLSKTQFEIINFSKF